MTTPRISPIFPWGRLIASLALLLCLVESAIGLPVLVRNAAVDALSGYVNEGPRLDRMLERVGFAPPAAPEKQIMSRMPAIRKIEAAYFAAEEARPNGGGKEFLARLRAEIAADFPAIHAEASLQMLSTVRLPPPPQPFQRKVTSTTRPPSPIWEMIRSIANYSSTGLGSQSGLLVIHFQMPEERAYEILRSSDTFADALQRAYTESGTNGDKNLRSLAVAVVKEHPAAKYEPAVDSLFKGRASRWAAGLAGAGAAAAAAGAWYVDKNGTFRQRSAGLSPSADPPTRPYTPPPRQYRPPPPRPFRP